MVYPLKGTSFGICFLLVKVQIFEQKLILSIGLHFLKGIDEEYDSDIGFSQQRMYFE